MQLEHLDTSKDGGYVCGEDPFPDGHPLHEVLISIVVYSVLNLNCLHNYSQHKSNGENCSVFLILQNSGCIPMISYSLGTMPYLRMTF